jgi:hypothetical protein
MTKTVMQKNQIIAHTDAEGSFLKHPSEKYFENAPKIKSSPQNNGKSTGFLKQMLYATRAWSKYLSKRNLKI